MKRLFDFVFATAGIVVLAPVFIVTALAIKLDSRGPILYKQKRVGRHGLEFFLFKFRTMIVDADRKGLLTVGGRDPRVTRIGYYLRKYKLDELPQLFNVFLANMSLVGPRPEVKKYVDMYTEQQRQILKILPGITDFASIHFRNENEILGTVSNPEAYYIDVVMPQKIRLNKIYIKNKSLLLDIFIIASTVFSVFKIFRNYKNKKVKKVKANIRLFFPL